MYDDQISIKYGTMAPHVSSKAALRAERILLEVRRAGSVSVERLCGILSVSVATVRRDLDALEEKGSLRRTHGGAIAIEPLFYEPFRNDSSFQDQVNRCGDEKRRIGLAAAELIQDGDVIALTPGTTTTEVVRNLRDRSDITIVCSTVNVAMELSGRKDLQVYITGGYLRGHWFSLVGRTAVAGASQIFADKMFIGVNGADAEHGLTSLSAEEADLISVMMRQSKRKIVVADHSKLGVVAAHLIAPVTEVEMLITDTGADDGQIAPFLAKDIRVVRA